MLQYFRNLPEYSHTLHLYEKDPYVVYAAFKEMMRKKYEKARLQESIEKTVEELTEGIIDDIDISI